MNNLKEFKKKMRKGLVLHIEHHTQAHMTRDTTVTAFNKTEITTNFNGEPSLMVYLPEGRYKFPGDGSVVVNDNLGKPLLTITFPEIPEILLLARDMFRHDGYSVDLLESDDTEKIYTFKFTDGAQVSNYATYQFKEGQLLLRSDWIPFSLYKPESNG